jgi:methionyl-tRNA synthetase
MTTTEQSLATHLQQSPLQIGKAIEQFKFKEGLQLCMDLARAGNKYLADTEPWHLIKTDKEHVGTILHMALQLTANLSILLEPFLPFTSHRLRTMLGITSSEAAQWAQAGSLALVQPGTALQTPTLLFEKITDEQIAIQQQRLHATTQAAATS